MIKFKNPPFSLCIAKKISQPHLLLRQSLREGAVLEKEEAVKCAGDILRLRCPQPA